MKMIHLLFLNLILTSKRTKNVENSSTSDFVTETITLKEQEIEIIKYKTADFQEYHIIFNQLTKILKDYRKLVNNNLQIPLKAVKYQLRDMSIFIEEKEDAYEDLKLKMKREKMAEDRAIDISFSHKIYYAIFHKTGVELKNIFNSDNFKVIKGYFIKRAVLFKFDEITAILIGIKNKFEQILNTNHSKGNSSEYYKLECSHKSGNGSKPFKGEIKSILKKVETEHSQVEGKNKLEIKRNVHFKNEKMIIMKIHGETTVCLKESDAVTAFLKRNFDDSFPNDDLIKFEVEFNNFYNATREILLQMWNCNLVNNIYEDAMKQICFILTKLFKLSFIQELKSLQLVLAKYITAKSSIYHEHCSYDLNIYCRS